MKRTTRLIHCTLVVALLALSACAPLQPVTRVQLPIVHGEAAPQEADAIAPVATFPGSAATEWFKLIVQLVRRTPGFSPPIAARVFGYSGIALYEAMVPGMPGYQTLSGQLNEMPPMPQPPAGISLHWPSVANSTLATLSRRLFPAITAIPLRDINRLEARLQGQYAEAAPAEVLAASQEYGRSVAEAVFEWSKSDGGHEGYVRNYAPGYTVATGQGLWEPTAPDFAGPLQPEWGNVRTFALTSGAECAPPPPPEYSTLSDSDFYREAWEVYDTVRSLTEEEREIALFWADDPGVTATPPGHSLSIATQVLRTEGSSLAQAAELYAKIGIALADSFVACWNTKFVYNVQRPLTYIQQVIDSTWNQPDPTDPLQTPPFPEYTSGHSVEARAAAEILTATFGDHYRFTDITNVDRGLAPRTFSSFYAAAAEAAVSRLYGGIHYRSAIEQGLAQGACVGRRVLELEFRVTEPTS